MSLKQNDTSSQPASDLWPFLNRQEVVTVTSDTVKTLLLLWMRCFLLVYSARPSSLETDFLLQLLVTEGRTCCGVLRTKQKTILLIKHLQSTRHQTHYWSEGKTSNFSSVSRVRTVFTALQLSAESLIFFTSEGDFHNKSLINKILKLSMLSTLNIYSSNLSTCMKKQWNRILNWCFLHFKLCYVFQSKFTFFNCNTIK